MSLDKIRFDEIENRVLHIIKKLVEEKGYYENDILSGEYTIRNMLNSVSFINLIVELEINFKIEVDDEAFVMGNFATFDKVVTMVKSLSGENE